MSGTLKLSAIEKVIEGHAPIYHSLKAGEEPRKLTLMERILWLTKQADQLPIIKADRDRFVHYLGHMTWCASCSQGDWDDCETGKQAKAALSESAK